MARLVGGGVSRFDRASKSFTAFTSKNAGLGDDNVFALHVDGSGTLWAGTQKHGVYRFDRARQRFESVLSAEQLVGRVPRTETSVAVRVIGGSPDGRQLLIGTEGSGLADYDITSGTVTLHQSLAADSSSLSGNTVRAAIEGSNGVVWIGTATGLDRSIARRSSSPTSARRTGCPAATSPASRSTLPACCGSAPTAASCASTSRASA